MRSRLLITLTALSAAMLPGIACGDAIYDVLVDTTPLLSSAAGPFSLDFQFTDGSGTDDGNHGVTLSNFTFGLGMPIGLPSMVGSVSGDLTEGVTMTDGSFFNEFTQGFSPGAILGFQVRLTTNMDLADVPDEFSMAILDKTMTGSAMLIADIDSRHPVMQTYPSVSLSLHAPSVIPEPAAGWLLAAGVLAMTVAGWSRWGRNSRRIGR